MRKYVSLMLFVAVTLFAVPAFALDLATDVDWFTFSGWDNAMVTGGGQTFTNVLPGLDATVVGTGSFSIPSKTKASDQLIISGLATPGSNTFSFQLSAPKALIIEYRTVDNMEEFIVDAVGAKTNTQVLGAPPSVTMMGTEIQIAGIDHGVPAPGNLVNGASAGYITTASVSSFTVTHEGTRNNKFEAFRVGMVKPVPEPAGGMLALLCVPVLMLRRRGVAHQA